MTLHPQAAVTAVLSKLCRIPVWICLLAVLEFTGVTGKLCWYQKSVYNPFQSVYDKVPTSEECQWGCCNHRNTPCCSAPLSLIVGSALGGALLLAVLLIIVCCCCFCRKQTRQEERRRGTAITQQTSVVFHSAGSGNNEELDTTFDPPPSYEEVMRGEVNQGFKPDTS
ncbi:uncharacterized protein LOC101860271 [Aplysia californica]|uniref:Uncharacterized protein LOC101860271 n=1 Tax=Aplysia californica TaxID=6500 RepID=A0ABM1A5W0_APLCA|nr:uncharacterized protein LOC101860271 [Aplysia californica]